MQKKASKQMSKSPCEIFHTNYTGKKTISAEAVLKLHLPPFSLHSIKSYDLQFGNKARISTSKPALDNCFFLNSGY